jgi:hypothetical protein
MAYDNCRPITKTSASTPTARVKKIRSHRMEIDASRDRSAAASSLE